MSQTSTEEVEVFAQELTHTLNHGETKEIMDALNRVIEATVWTKAFYDTKLSGKLENALFGLSRSSQFTSDSTLKDLAQAALDAFRSRVREDWIRRTEARWWHAEPVPEDVGRITFEFRDVTAQHKTWLVEEVWTPETIECASSEAFERAAQRFRVQADRKYRHPFFPSMHFDAVLRSGLASFDSLASRQMADILADLSDVGIVPYVRNDDLGQESPWRFFKPWERTLPAWCSTPDHWIEPVPPPGFVESPVPPPLEEQYYKKVPTLHMPGNGRRIIPSAKKPDIISRALFIPVKETFMGTEMADLQHDVDLVPYGAHLVPGSVTLDAARALLGRVIQSSREPRSDPDAPPAGKRRKVNKAAQSLGIAWGLETSSDGVPLWLHCLRLSSFSPTEYVLPLSGDTHAQYEPHSPISIRTQRCAWLGAAVLPADVKALKQETGDTSEHSDAELEANGRLSYGDWADKTMAWIQNLNMEDSEPVVEVGPDGSFVGGDLGTSKGDDDEFEVEITGAKPGIWLMSVEPDEDNEGNEHELTGREPRIIRFTWARDGTVNYDALPQRTTVRAQNTDPDADWEVVASFSVDSGMICLFSKHALNSILSLGRDTDREAMLETFIDEDEGTNVFVPGGVVTTGDDGGYEIEGRRDAEGRILELRLRV